MRQIIIIASILCAAQALPDYSLLSYANVLALRVDNANTGSSLTCKAAGLQCNGCDKVSYCMQEAGGNFTEIELGACNANETCRNGICSTDPNTACDSASGNSFKCNSIGMFPDTSDCQWYHVCYKEGETSARYQCEGNYYYDPVSTYCRLAYPSTGCPASTRLTCSALGQMGTHPANRAIYYICMRNNGKLVPSLFLCENGKIFTNGRCP